MRDHNACASQVELFQKYFGSEVELTPEVVQKYASEFDIYWCAQNLLTPELYERYFEAIAIALKHFEEAKAIALKQYEEGVRMADVCTKRLTEAEKKVEVLMKMGAGKFKNVPFEESEENLGKAKKRKS